MSIFSAIRNHIEYLYNSTCDIYIFENKIDENGICDNKEKIKYKNVNCRLSYNSNKNNIIKNKHFLNYNVEFDAKLFYPPDIKIPIGCKIVINDIVYKSVSVPHCYISHNEILIKIYGYV